MKEPTADEIASLPVFDIIDPTGVWNSKGLPTEEFNLQLCNEVLALRGQRRARAANRAPGSIWDASDIALWQARLAFAPTDVTRKTLAATTQMVELEENHGAKRVILQLANIKERWRLATLPYWVLEGGFFCLWALWGHTQSKALFCWCAFLFLAPSISRRRGVEGKIWEQCRAWLLCYDDILLRAALKRRH